LLPRRIVADVQLHGAVLDSAETLEAVQISEGTELTATLLPRIAERMRKFYESRGYPRARVVVDTSDVDDPTRVVLAVYIESGPPRRIAQRVFVIDPREGRELGDLKSEYKLGQGARLDEQALIEADREMTELLKQKGFYRAEVRHAQRNVGDFGYLYVYLDTGPRIRPAFEGNHAFDKDQLAQALNLEKSPEWKIGELVERLRTFYVRRGFLDVDITAAERGRPDEPVHFLAFTIAEHQQVRVARRVFPCLRGPFSPDDLGKEIDSFLEDELPGADVLANMDPRTMMQTIGPTEGAGRRGMPPDLNPRMTYAADTYERALKHLRDLVHSKGYLNAVVGPISVVRGACAKDSPAEQCIEEPLPDPPKARCMRDAIGLPLPEPTVPDVDTCHPSASKGVACAPVVTLRIPVQLGPETTLYDLGFDGNKHDDEKALAKVVDLDLGKPLSNLELEAARVKLLDHYKDEGYAYAEVRWGIEPSPDRTRARVRFYVTEREQVIVSGIVVRGNQRTSTSLIIGRLDLKVGAPYRQSWVRTSEEQIATLGTFSSVSIALEDPDVPQRQKRVIITVAEQLPQYLDPLVGFSTGDGIRFAIEYGHHNVAGYAVSVTLRVQLSYIFDFMILDPQVKTNYDTLAVAERLERRDTVSVIFPEVGLGPRVSLGLDAIDVRDNQRDFGITKEALVPSLTYRPFRTLTTQLSASGELNDVGIFNQAALADAISLLRVPEGRTIAVAERVSATWDARDNPFAATRGILLAGSIEHVNAFPSDTADNPATIISHFLKFTGKIAGYIRFTNKGTALALSLAGGYNFQLSSTSETYPDRLFFMGGVDTIRSFLTDALVPQDVAVKIQKGAKDANGAPLTIDDVVLRGGDLYLNPRAELRVPLTETFALGLFLDMGNVWVEPGSARPWELRYGPGAGLRIASPIGPIALDYGIDLWRREWEDFGAFSFSIGLF
jgi:outer membrane protein assembly factor BamA